MLLEDEHCVSMAFLNCMSWYPSLRAIFYIAVSGPGRYTNSDHSQLMFTIFGVSTVLLFNQLIFKFVFLGHNVQVSCIVFHPQATLTQDNAGICMATCAYDGSVKLWSLERWSICVIFCFKNL